ncbi:hypothetical protein AGMMS49579_06800 [Spirochaetia bacterium]|nr:hypothetical protein AGMMS49579_06800 [Spirochaetia bacterium]
MIFEWDEAKRLSNLEKHGLDFMDAHEVFEDDARYSKEDKRFSYGEKRFITVGEMKSQLVLALCHTDRNGRVRIISLRPASRQERRFYHGNS